MQHLPDRTSRQQVCCIHLLPQPPIAVNAPTMTGKQPHGAPLPTQWHTVLRPRCSAPTTAHVPNGNPTPRQLPNVLWHTVKLTNPKEAPKLWRTV